MWDFNSLSAVPHEFWGRLFISVLDIKTLIRSF